MNVFNRHVQLGAAPTQRVESMSMSSSSALAATVLAGVLLHGAAALAGTITSPVGGAIISGGPGSGSLADTYNQNGLLTTFVSGVTDFDTYVAGNPQHSLVFAGREWFSNSDTDSASVYYDMGAPVTMAALALWNEDVSGIGALSLFTSNDALAWTSWSAGLLPVDSIGNQNYGVQVFDLADRTARYVRFDMSQCPQPSGSFPACAIGEVAFNVVTATPEPATVALLGAALVGLAARRRRA